MEEKEMKVYEVAFNLVPDIGEENVAKSFGDIKASLESKGASFISEEMPKEINLAYEMKKVRDNKNFYFNKAYFGWIKFEISADKMDEVKELMEKNIDVLRYLIVKTVKENTLAPKKFTETKESTRKRRAPKEESAPINEEEVDAKIDELLDEGDSDESKSEI